MLAYTHMHTHSLSPPLALRLPSSFSPPLSPPLSLSLPLSLRDVSARLHDDELEQSRAKANAGGKCCTMFGWGNSKDFQNVEFHDMKEYFQLRFRGEINPKINHIAEKEMALKVLYGLL